MSQKLYINKQDWGRDLLSELAKVLNIDEGGLNAWDSLPTTGPDGNPLDESDNGYSGILQSNQPSLVRWSGHSWVTLMKVPLSYQGEAVPFVTTSISSLFHRIFDPGFQLDYFFIFELVVYGSTAGVVRKYSKTSLNLLWSANVSFGGGFQSADADQILVDSSGNLYLIARLYAGPNDFRTLNNPHELKIYSYTTSGILRWTSGNLAQNNASSVSGRPVLVGSSLFVQINWSYIIYRINTANGIIEANSTLAFDVPAYYSQLWHDENSGFIVAWIQATSTSFLYRIPLNLESIDSALQLDPVQFLAEGHNNIIQDPQFRNLFYVFGKANTPSYQMWVYNALNNTFSYLAVVGDNSVNLAFTASIKKISSTLLKLYQVTGEVFSEYEVDLAAETIVKKGFFAPAGVGTIQSPRIKDTLEIESSYLLKRSVVERGFSNESLMVSKIYSSNAKMQVVSFDNAFVSSAAIEGTTIRKEFNTASLYAAEFAAPIGAIDRLSVGNSLGSADGVSNSLRLDAGVQVGNLGSLFSIFRAAGGLSPESKGYTGGGAYVSGQGSNISVCGGKFFPLTAFASCVSLFDAGIGKFFLQAAPAQTAGTTITNFPGTAGMIVTTANNFGFGTESPAYKVDVNGTLRATVVMNSGGVVTSDPRMKLNMTYLSGEDSWEVVQLIKPISFVYKPDFSVTTEEITQDEDGNPVVTRYVRDWPLPQGIQFGYNADEAGETLPELIDIEAGSGIKYLNSGAIAPIVHQGTVWKINQLQQIIEQQQTLIESLTARVEVLENAD